MLTMDQEKHSSSSLKMGEGEEDDYEYTEDSDGVVQMKRHGTQEVTEFAPANSRSTFIGKVVLKASASYICTKVFHWYRAGKFKRWITFELIYDAEVLF